MAYAELPPWRRKRLHQRIAETIEALHAAMTPALVKRLVLVGTPLDIRPGSMSLLPSELDDRFREALRAGDLERAMHFFVATIVTDPDTGELAEQFTRNLLRLPRETILSNWAPDPEVDIAPVLGKALDETAGGLAR